MAAAICCEHRLASLKLVNVVKGNKEQRIHHWLSATSAQHRGLCLKRFPAGPVQRIPVKHFLQRALSVFTGERFTSVLGLRIDVETSPWDIERELEMLYERLHRVGDVLWNLPVIDVGIPELLFRYREADGDHYIYVEDPKRRRLAGYTVFNRLVELDKQADRYLRATHSKYADAYQRRGIATAIYTWWLDAGHCLISGARQSQGAHALWQALGRRYDLFYVDLRDKKLRFLGWRVAPLVQDALYSRMILLGKGWNTSGLAQATGMRMAETPRKAEHRPLNRALICRTETKNVVPNRSNPNASHINQKINTS